MKKWRLSRKRKEKERIVRKEEECNLRFTVIFIIAKKRPLSVLNGSGGGVKNHLNFTSKNCKIKKYMTYSNALAI